MTQDSYSARRARLAEAMGDGVAIVPAAPVAIRNNDVEHSYRQDSDLYYLTGFEEPESVLVLIAEGGAPRAVLFVRPRDPEREVWDGSRAGVEGAVERFGADEAFPITELSEQLPTLLLDRARVFYRLGRDRAFDERFISALVTVRGRARSGVIAPRELVDLGAVLHEQRLVKGPEELEAMRQAIAISREAHAAAMRAARPGAYEHEVEAAILQRVRHAGEGQHALDQARESQGPHQLGGVDLREAFVGGDACDRYGCAGPAAEGVASLAPPAWAARPGGTMSATLGVSLTITGIWAASITQAVICLQ